MSVTYYERFFLLVSMLFALVMLYGQTNKLVVISGSSMDPTLKDGDVVVASTVVDLTVGKVYVLKMPDRDQVVVKRLIGVPGDTLEFVNGALYRNGVCVEERQTASWDNATYNLGFDEYMFVGDNRGESYDSRYWSRMPHRSEIFYELSYVLYPKNHRKEVR